MPVSRTTQGAVAEDARTGQLSRDVFTEVICDNGEKLGSGLESCMSSSYFMKNDVYSAIVQALVDLTKEELERLDKRVVILKKSDALRLSHFLYK